MNSFIIRLQEIIKYYDLTASSFAKSIDVQRSSISHLLSGRNKPSLDFVMKVLNTYEQVELNWLIKGEGVFPKQKNLSYPSNLFDEVTELEKKKSNTNTVVKELYSDNDEIERIIIFYKNGTFKKYVEL